ncbi:MAG: cyclopropane-fatty-acyl-phospholipid synthase family protein [Alphaproteobacteria bacterium]
MFDFLALAIMRQFVICGTLDLTLANGSGHQLLGRSPGPHASITIHDRATFLRLVIKPDLAFGEAYMDGRISTGNGGIDALMELLMLNSRHWSRHWAGRLTLRFGNCLAWLRHLNPRWRSRRNVAHHYDLTDELFETFLDPRRQYSCAYFHRPDDSLETAQETKLARLAAKLNLRPVQSVLDIGCGWGGLAMAMTECRENLSVTGITLSERQLAHARKTAAEHSLEDRLDFALRDYRDQGGAFDRIVSVGMLEHVGPADVPAYFRTVRRLLVPGGVAVIHSIAVHDRAAPVNRWMTRYIFPGGHLPSLPQLVRAAEAGGLKILDMEIMRGHYAETLLHWRMRFLRNRDRITALYDECFVLMWEFYLAGCVYFFRCQHGMVVQIQLSDDHQAVPESRDYITELENQFRDRLCRNDPSGKTRASAT